jgi:hypothetical protein
LLLNMMSVKVLLSLVVAAAILPRNGFAQDQQDLAAVPETEVAAVEASPARQAPLIEAPGLTPF